MAQARPDYAPLLSSAQATRLAAEWGIRIDPGQVLLRPGAFGTTAEIAHEGRRYVLKVVAGGTETAARLTRVAATTEALRAAGFPVPRHRQTENGRLVVISEREQHVARLLEWLPGESFECGNLAQIRSAAVLLARLHSVVNATIVRGSELVSDRPETSGRGSSRRCGDLRSANRQGRETLAERDLHRDVATVRQSIRRGRAITMNRRSWLSAVAAAGERAQWELAQQAGGDTSSALCHGDFRAQNVGFHGNDVCALYDLDSLHSGDPLADLAYALVFFPAVVCTRPFTKEEVDGFVEYYAHERPLSPTERDRLPLLMTTALVKGIALWLRLGEHPGGEAAVARWLDAYRGFPDLLRDLQATPKPSRPT